MDAGANRTAIETLRQLDVGRCVTSAAGDADLTVDFADGHVRQIAFGCASKAYNRACLAEAIKSAVYGDNREQSLHIVVTRRMPGKIGRAVLEEHYDLLQAKSVLLDCGG